MRLVVTVTTLKDWLEWEPSWNPEPAPETVACLVRYGELLDEADAALALFFTGEARP